jgi:tRNA pseudouridine38-40 synthase
MARLRLTVAYHGGAFHGLAPQPGQRTVVGVLAEALAKMLRLPEPPMMTMSGRTDAGVHAWGQVLHLQLPDGASAETIDTHRIGRSLYRMLSPEIVVRNVTVVGDEFDARFSATSRRYKYTVLNDEYPDPWLADTAWHVPSPLNIDLMRLGCDPLLGEHDFSSFCGAPERPGLTNNRCIFSATWTRQIHDPRLLVFEISGNAFCRQMVRSVTGLLVDIGRGNRTPGEVLGVLNAKDRNAAGSVAPSHGLCLWEVSYPVDLTRKPRTYGTHQKDTPTTT